MSDADKPRPISEMDSKTWLTFFFGIQTAERQHLLDTWDPVLFEGQPDSEEPKPDFIDRYLIPANAGEEPRKSEQSESSIMDEILPDMDFFDDDSNE